MPLDDQRPPPPSFSVVVVIIVVDLLIIGAMGYTGALQRLPEWAQFYYGLATFGFPILVYFLIKRRHDRRD
jgi:hypothetical protein